MSGEIIKKGRELISPDRSEQIKTIFGDIPELSGFVEWNGQTIPLAFAKFDLSAKELVYTEKKNALQDSDYYKGFVVEYSKVGEQNFRRQANFAQTELNPKPVLTHASVSYFLDGYEFRYGYENDLGFSVIGPQAQLEFDLDKLTDCVSSIHIQVLDTRHKKIVLAETGYHYEPGDQKYKAYFTFDDQHELSEATYAFQNGVNLDIGTLSGVKLVDRRDWKNKGRTLVNSMKSLELSGTPYKFRTTRAREFSRSWGGW